MDFILVTVNICRIAWNGIQIPNNFLGEDPPLYCVPLHFSNQSYALAGDPATLINSTIIATIIILLAVDFYVSDSDFCMCWYFTKQIPFSLIMWGWFVIVQVLKLNNINHLFFVHLSVQAVEQQLASPTKVSFQKGQRSTNLTF